MPDSKTFMLEGPTARLKFDAISSIYRIGLLLRTSIPSINHPPIPTQHTEKKQQQQQQ